MDANELKSLRDLLGGATVRAFGRAVDMGVMELVDSNDNSVAIHIQCPFRVVRDGAIVLGSRDMRYSQTGAGERAFEEFKTVFDRRASSLNVILERLLPSVLDVAIATIGDLAVSWEPNFRLEAFPDCSGVIEAWRILIRNGRHYVFPPDAA